MAQHFSQVASYGFELPIHLALAAIFAMSDQAETACAIIPTRS
jgi:hypothetical protein